MKVLKKGTLHFHKPIAGRDKGTAQDVAPRFDASLRLTVLGPNTLAISVRSPESL